MSKRPPLWCSKNPIGGAETLKMARLSGGCFEKLKIPEGEGELKIDQS